MVHYIYAVVAAAPLATELAAQGGSRHLASLGHGLSIVAFEEEQLEVLAGEPPEDRVDGFDCLYTKLQDRLAAASRNGDLVYLETQYTGGSGAQGAALFRAGAQAWCRYEPSQPLTSNSPINRALRELGVVANGRHDEFDTVGLSRFRLLSDFERR